jgi:cadherin-like protein
MSDSQGRREPPLFFRRQKIMKRTRARNILAVSIALAFAGTAHAVLERMGPIDNASSVGGYPSWYQDKTGLAIEFCDPKNQAELNGGWCVLIPPTPATAPETFPANYFNEHFYWNGNAQIDVGAMRARLILGIEGAFANNVVLAGDQVTFGRIRVNITGIPFTGTYTVYHPYGTWIFPNIPAGGRIFFTQDIGLACVGTFECTLGTDIGPFLLPSATPGGAEVPPIPDIAPGQDPFYDILVNTGVATAYPNTGKKYIADPARIGPVTGSPLLPFIGNDGATYNHNTFRVEGPNGFFAQTNDFTVAGRVMAGAMPGKVSVDRASFAQSLSGAAVSRKVDVFATGQPTTQGRLPAQPQPAAILPALKFFDAPCGGTLDPNTGQLVPPYSAPAGATETVMNATGSRFWGQAHPVAIPPAVCVEDTNSRDANGLVVPTFYNVAVTDEVTPVTGSGATWDSANGGTLTVTAVSSDSVNPPVLTVAGFGTMLNGTIAVTPMAVPPSTVQVASSEGGNATFLVQTGLAAGGTPPATPLALNDAFVMFEDCSATAATTCATPPVFDVLANDTFGGGAIPAGATVAITAAPRLGTATVGADGSITYRPNANANGTDSIGYSVTVNGIVSNTAQVTVTIQPVNDPPVAVNDAAGVVVGIASNVNVIANDTDIDGNADVANARIVSWPPELGLQPTPVNGVVSFTPVAAGVFAFTYQAIDRANVSSANTATVTITATTNEQIAITRSRFRTGNFGGTQGGRWQVDGTDTVSNGQTLSIVYNNGTLSAAFGGGTCNGTAANPNCVIGTAVVSATGAWLLDRVVNLNTKDDPTSATVWASKPTTVRVFSSSPALGGTQTATIQ